MGMVGPSHHTTTWTHGPNPNMGFHKVVLMPADTFPTKWVLSNKIVTISYYEFPKTSIPWFNVTE